MSYFPVTNSNLSATHLAQFLLEKYALGANTACRILKAGINDTYLVDAPSGKSIFRVYSLNWRSETEICEEIRLLSLLKENNISVSYPVADASGNYIQEFAAPEGNRFGVMFSYAPGEKTLNFSSETHFQIGELMAKIHRITNELTLKRVHYTAKILVQDSLEQLERFLPDDTEEMEFMRSTQKYLLNEFEKADASRIRKGAVHMDMWFDNMNVSREKGVTIFDFDFCGNGWLCMDLAYYILQVHSTEKEPAERDEKIRSFFAGYESVTTIDDEEKRIIPMLGVSMYFFYLGIQSLRYDNWSNLFFNDVYLKRYITILVKKYFEANCLGVQVP